ncbi:MAG: RnfABCDGE type electron transport complex subunit D [Candidatus Cloacimonadota bacterium]|nr:RnfABCDGE type electron transport complex subunit D [Candidatus Cloacimonadota bacterium]
MNLLNISTSPHFHEKIDVKIVMWSVVGTLFPALIAAYIFFGWYSIFLTALGVITAVATEALIQHFRKVPITISDGSAVITGLLLSFNLPPNAPWWLPVLGSVFAISIGKQVFGGLGYNPVNPALLGRAFLMASWPVQMTTGWASKLAKASVVTVSGLKNSLIAGSGNESLQNLITSATPLNLAQQIRGDIADGVGGEAYRTIFDNLSSLDYIKSLFWGNVGGCIGEVSAAALIIGAAYLVYKHYIEWRIPVSYIGTVIVFSWMLGGIDGLFSGPILFHVFSGGLILGAFFMATDMVTSPVTKNGRIYFGLGCGILTVVIRLWGGYPEGVSYSILIMNLAVPLLDKITPQKTFGYRKKN